MDAYCQEVFQLEDKFDGLELNHIPRCLNEVANALAKRVCSLVINTNPRCATKGQNRPMMALQIGPQGPT